MLQWSGFRGSKWWALIAVATCLSCALEALARAGGGQSYTPSFGGGGSGGGGGGGDGVVWLIYLALRYPQVGVPVLIIVVVFSIVKHMRNPDHTTARAISRLSVAPRLDKGALAEIASQDTAFSEQQFLNRVTKTANSVQDAWSLGSMETVRPLLSDGLMRRFETQLEIQRFRGLRNVLVDHRVLTSAIHAASRDENFETIHVELHAEGRDADLALTLSSEKALEAAKKAKLEPFTEIWSFLRRPGATTRKDGGAIEGRCPNCGAPLDIGQTVRCDHCKALVNSGEYDWVLAEITQPEEWRIGSTGAVPGLTELMAADPGFNRQVAEDRASYLFWRWIEALVRGKSKPLLKISSSSFRREFEQTSAGQSASLFRVAIGGVDLSACEIGKESQRDRCFVKVKWSSARSQKNPASPMSNLLILSRTSGAKSLGGLAHARCRVCAGPLVENDAPVCDYCGSPLDPEQTDWVLEEVRQPEELPVLLRANRNLERGSQTVEWALPDLGDKRERTLLLMRMAAIVVADKQVTKAERKLLQNASKRWNVPLESVTPILEGEVTGDVGLSLRPSNPEAFITGLIHAALVDGKVDKKEERLLLEVGNSLEMDPGQVRQLIKSMSSRVAQHL